MWRDPGRSRPTSGRRDPGHRDLVRRDRRRASSPTPARSCSNVVASQAELHARYGGVVPEIASRRHLELVVAGRARGARRGGRRRSTTSTRSRVTRGPGPDRRAARRALGGEGDRLGAAAAARAGRPPARARRVALPRAATSSRRSSACSRPAATRCCSTCATAAGYARARHDARRRRRRGVRQGRAAARPRLPRRRGDRPARARRRPRGLRRSRSRACPASTSRSPGSRPRCSTRARARAGGAGRRRADLAARYQRAIVRALVERDPRGGATGRPDRGRRRRRRELGAARGAAGRGRSRRSALHRQRRDDRLGRAVRGARRLSRVPGLDAYAAA